MKVKLIVMIFRVPSYNIASLPPAPSYSVYHTVSGCHAAPLPQEGPEGGDGRGSDTSPTGT